MRKRALFHLATVLAGIALTFTAGMATASADTGTGGLPILHASEYQVAHKCSVIGSDNLGNQAVVCADLETEATWDIPGPTYPYYVWAQAEAYCQTTAGVAEQCANIGMDAGYANQADGLTAAQLNGCGHAAGDCPKTRLYAVTDYWEFDSSWGCSTDPGSEFDVWGLVVGSGFTQIELPGSDKTITLGTSNANDGPNESTGHYYICF